MASLRINIVALLAFALVLVAAGCGGGTDQSKSVPPGAIAIVGEQEIAKADFDRLIEQAEASYKAQQQEFPKAGSPEYEQLKNAIVKSLVQQSTWKQEAAAMGIEVTDAEVEKRLDELKKQFFGGDEKRYEQEIKKQGLTDARIRDDIRTRLLTEKIHESVTGKVKLTDAAIEGYYEKNQAQFEQPESRKVRHILVKTKAKADEIYQQLRSGGDFAQLAKKFSQDPGSAAQGGELEAVKGSLVKPFEESAFSLESGELSKPVKTEFGWHVIQAIEAIKPSSVTPLAKVKDDIRQTLLQQKQNAAVRNWVNDVKRKYADEISYAPGFAPARTGTGASQTSTQ
jgi:parvulin-like peptidyl-prolyl isomerase